MFTNNRWTLADETVELFKSDLFYRQHVRWNMKRYRPSDTTDIEKSPTETSCRPREISQSAVVHRVESNHANVFLMDKSNDHNGTDNVLVSQQVPFIASHRRKRFLSEDISDRMTRNRSKALKQK